MPIPTEEGGSKLPYDAAHAGFYSYAADVITQSCGEVQHELLSEKYTEQAEHEALDEKTMVRIVADFQP